MRNAIAYIAAMLVLCFANSAYAFDAEAVLKKDAEAIKLDYKGFYTDIGNLLRLAGGIGAAGVLANSSADREFQETYQDNIRSKSTNNISKAFKLPGEVVLTVPLVAGLHIFAPEGSPVSVWAGRSFRALILGGPAGLILQRATGASRPDERDSHWRPFKDSNGLSGHAFTGAVPFLAAASMQDNPYAKAALIGASTLPALSRINDNRHYLSQAALGWYLAYLSTTYITDGKGEDAVFSAAPVGKDGFMVMVEASF